MEFTESPANDFGKAGFELSFSRAVTAAFRTTSSLSFFDTACMMIKEFSYIHPA